MIRFPKPKFAKPAYRRATRSKDQKLQALAGKRAFLAAQAEVTRTAVEAVDSQIATLEAQEQEQRDLTEQRREEERDYFGDRREA